MLTINSDTAAKVPTMDTYLADIKAKNAAGASPPIMGAFVVYDLPNRDCSALASNGEYQVAQDGLTKYKAYIDSIAAILKKYPEVSVSLVIGKSRHHDHHHHPLPLIKLINYPLRT
jgi:cellulose 1,4-beta-cellobiosidase